MADQTPQPMGESRASNDQMLAAVQNAVTGINNLANPISNLSEAIINVSSSGASIVLPVTQGKTNKVYSLFFTVSTPTDITFNSGETALTGPMTFIAAGSQMFLDFRPQPWFTCDQNATFNLNLSVAAQISGRVYYTAT